MERYKNYIKDKFFNKDYPVRHILFNTITLITAAGGIFSLILSFFISTTVEQLYLVLVCIFVLSLCLYIANYKQKLELAAIIIIFCISIVLFPLMFLTGGGISGGMSHWFVLGIVFSFILLTGKPCIILVITQIIVYSLCFYAAYTHPEIVIPFDSAYTIFLDIIQSMYIAALTLGFIVHFQIYSYEKILRKNELQKKQLKELALEAQRANQAKSDFLSRMSHDIRTPINGIIGMLEIAEKNENDIDKVRDCHEKIRNASGHLLSLINSVLDMNKLESGKMELAHSPFDLSLLLQSCEDITKPMALENGLTLTSNSSSQLKHSHLIGSPLHLRQILINLSNNSIKYNKPDGEINISVEEITSDDNTATFKFVIEDTGIGMSEEFQEHMFEAFSQENTASTSKYTGSGLGLAIVKEMVELMNGSLSVESKVNVGSKFVITISFEIDKDYVNPENNDENNTSNSIDGMNILLVEDNELNIEIARFMLESANANVTEAHNGKLAVEAFASSDVNYFDLIIMDIMMPEMNGLEATKAIRSLDRPDAKTIPIVAMSANAFYDDVQKSLECGMNEHIAKPIDVTNVLSTLSKYNKK